MRSVSVLAVALLGAGAQAQSSVSLTGVADLAVRQVRNEGLGAVTSQASGSNATSRLAFRGSEDMGGGLRAGFHLETGILLDTGTNASATQFYDRRSTLSLSHTSLGELRAGRDFVPSYVGWSRYDPFGYVGVGGSNNLFSATPTGPIRSAFSTSPNTTVRSSNSVQWLYTQKEGLDAGLMLALGEGGSAANGQHKLRGLRLGWDTAAWAVSAAETRTQNNLTGTQVLRDRSFGARLSTGNLRLSAAWRKLSFASATQTNSLLGASWVMGATELKASWVRADMAGTMGTTALGANDATQVALGVVHNLSRRTGLYATTSRVGNKGAATFNVPGGASGLAGGKASSGTELGLRHTF